MEDNLNEFINSDMELISKKTPDNIDPKTSAKTTTDKSVKMSRQPYNWTIYNIKLQEKELEYSKKANELSQNPEQFYSFLESIGQANKFEEYFEKTDPKTKLKEISKVKAYEVMEALLNRKNNNDIITRNLPTIEEIKNKEMLLLDKLTKIAETIKEVMSEDEKKVIMSYFSEKIK